MKQALISPTEKVYKYDGTLLGDRVAETAETPFDVADPLTWVSCADEVIADQFYYDGQNVLPIPVKPIPVEPTV